VVHRGGVRLVEPDSSRRQRGIDIAVVRVGRKPGIDLPRGVQVVTIGVQLGVVRALRVVEPDQARGLSGDLRAVRENCSDDLATEVDLLGLQNRQLGIVGRGEPRRVAVGEHGQNPGQAGRGFDVHRHDLAGGDGGLDRV
jgi:hypothetical protein